MAADPMSFFPGLILSCSCNCGEEEGAGRVLSPVSWGHYVCWVPDKEEVRPYFILSRFPSSQQGLAPSSGTSPVGMS